MLATEDDIIKEIIRILYDHKGKLIEIGKIRRVLKGSVGKVIYNDIEGYLNRLLDNGYVKYETKRTQAYVDTLTKTKIPANSYKTYRITESGILYYKEKNNSENTKQAFVAMWFSEDMKDIYDNYIYKAIKVAGYLPLKIDNTEHINKICDQIITEIRKSKFIIADLTGHRGGVYYEAGIAHGLGIPVIFTCRKDWFNGYVKQKITTYDDSDIPKEIDVRLKENVHFDVRQYNCIVWETGEELYEKLKNRIETVIM